MPNVPVAPANFNPWTNIARGPGHQRVKAPDEVTFPPAHYSPVPVASVLKNGTTGTAYSETIGAQGGTSPYTFAVTSGSLPTGTTMTSGGVISGTPTVAASFSFTVAVTDSLGYIGSYSFSISVTAPAASGGYSVTFCA